MREDYHSGSKKNKESDKNFYTTNQLRNLDLSNNQKINNYKNENLSDQKCALKIDSSTNLNNFNLENQFETSNDVRKKCDEIKMYKFSRNRKEIKMYSYK